MSTRTFRDAIADTFKAHPHQWLSAYQLMQIGGALAFRTRVSEARRELGMDIVNRVERDTNGVASSYYMYRPPVPMGQAELFETRQERV